MLTELCQYLRNWFERDKHFGTFTIANNAIEELDIPAGQYVRIIGSIFNDGVFKYGTDTLQAETFTGAVWGLGIPKAVIDLSKDIDDWREKYDTLDSPNLSPYTSESFGGYSYTKGAGNGSSAAVTWQSQFAGRLSPWRKI